MLVSSSSFVQEIIINGNKATMILFLILLSLFCYIILTIIYIFLFTSLDNLKLLLSAKP